MTELTKGYIGKEDHKQYDGSTATFSRKTSTGGTANINIFDEHVDAYMVGGEVLTSAAINYALDVIGSSNCTLYIKPGAWVIDADITIPTNVNIKVPLGAKMTIAAAITLTINGGIIAGHYEIFAGTGTVTGTVINAFLDSVWSNALTTDTLALTADSSSITLQDISMADLTVSGTVTAEQLTSTDDATITDDLAVGGNGTVGGTLAVTSTVSCADPTTDNHVGDRAYNDARYIGGNVANTGMLQRAKFEYKDADEIYINPGTYQHAGTSSQVLYWDSQLTLVLTSLDTDKWTYVYIDDSAVVTAGTALLTAAEFIDSNEDTATPAYSVAKHGWYNGLDRCVFATRGTAADTQLAFYHDGGDFIGFVTPIEDLASAALAGSTAVALTIPSFSSRAKIKLGFYGAGDTDTYFGYSASPTTTISKSPFTYLGLVYFTVVQSTIYLDEQSNSEAWVETLGWHLPIGI